MRLSGADQSSPDGKTLTHRSRSTEANQLWKPAPSHSLRRPCPQLSLRLHVCVGTNTEHTYRTDLLSERNRPRTVRVIFVGVFASVPLTLAPDAPLSSCNAVKRWTISYGGAAKLLAGCNFHRGPSPSSWIGHVRHKSRASERKWIIATNAVRLAC